MIMTLGVTLSDMDQIISNIISEKNHKIYTFLGAFKYTSLCYGFVILKETDKEFKMLKECAVGRGGDCAECRNPNILKI